jgi:HEAT repeats
MRRATLRQLRRGHAGVAWPAVLVVFVLSVALSIVLGPGARADDRTNFLIDRLRYPPSAGQSDDFRIRAQAALALGASNDDRAVQPLCQALSDPNDAVRTAVAAALGRLARPAGAECLKARLSSESSSSVQGQIQKAIEASSGGSSGGPPRNVANAKFYVALAPISNGTGRPQSEIDRIVLGAVRAKFDSLGKYQLAPSGESPESARSVISARNLKAYYLSISVDKFDYSNGNLRVRVKVAISGYPGKDLKGEVGPGMTQTGVNPGDRSSEDNLMGMVTAQAIDQFAQNFQ